MEGLNLNASLGLDISGFSHGMLEAESLMRVFPASVQNFIANPLLGLIGIAEQAGSALVRTFKQITDAQDHLRDSAQALGVGVSFLDAMGKAGELAGTNTEGMADALRFLSKAQVDAAGGSESAQAAFAALGVQATDASGNLIPLEELTWKVIDGFKAMPDGAQQTTVALELLGRSGLSVANFFNQGRGAIEQYIRQLQQYGAITTEEAAASADAWNDLMGEAGHAWEGIRMQIAEPLRDALKPYLESVLQWVRDHPDEIKEKVHALAEGITHAIIGIGQVITGLLPVIESLANHLGAAIFGAAALQAIKIIDQLIAGYKALAASIVEANAAAASSNFTPPRGGVAGAIGGAGGWRGPAMAGAFGVFDAMGRGAGTGETIGEGAGGALGSWGGRVALGALGGSIAGPPGAAVGALIGLLGGGYLGSQAGAALGKGFDTPAEVQKAADQMQPVKIPAVPSFIHNDNPNFKDPSFDIPIEVPVHVVPDKFQPNIFDDPAFSRIFTGSLPYSTVASLAGIAGMPPAGAMTAGRDALSNTFNIDVNANVDGRMSPSEVASIVSPRIADAMNGVVDRVRFERQNAMVGASL